MESSHFPQKILDALLLEIETSIQSEFHACNAEKQRRFDRFGYQSQPAFGCGETSVAHCS